MSISDPDLTLASASNVSVGDDTLTVDLTDGRSLVVPLLWYPRLVHASKAEREAWRLIGHGTGIRWPDIEEDISVESLLNGRCSAETAKSLQAWLASRNKKA